jgi:hypothetical protein
MLFVMRLWLVWCLKMLDRMAVGVFELPVFRPYIWVMGKRAFWGRGQEGQGVQVCVSLALALLIDIV